MSEPTAWLRPVLAIAWLALVEARRKKLLIALLVVTVLAIALSNLLFAEIPNIAGGRDQQPITPALMKTIVSQVLVLIMFMFSFVLALSAVFMASPSISGEIESGVVLAVLTRPLSRAQLLLGKWLGLSALTTLYVVGASATEFILTSLDSGYAPPHPIAFTLYMTGETVVILTLAVLISTRMSAMAGGIVALGAFGAAWIGGIIGAIGQAFGNDTVAGIGTVTRLLVPSDALWHGAIYSLEPDVVIAAANQASRGFASNPFVATVGPPLSLNLWAVAWIVGVLALAVWSFRRREI